MKLGHYLKRTKQTYAAFAELIDVSAPQVCRWVNDEYKPSLTYVERIHRATNGHVTAADFLPADLPAPQALDLATAA